MSQAETAHSPLRQNLRHLAWLRLAMALALAAAMAVWHWALDLELPLAPLAGVLVMLLGLVVLAEWRRGRAWPVLDAEMLLQLCLDVAVISVLLYFTGGASNPFVSLYLLPVTIAATTLPRRHAAALTVLAAAGYSLLMVYYVPLMPGAHAHHGAQDFTLHVVGMWVNFLVCAVLVLWIVSRMAGALRERDRQLALAREKAMRDDRILSIGLLAAGAAHELATPVSTMAVLVKDMAAATRDDPERAEDLHTLKAQVDHCRQVIQGLAASAGQARETQSRFTDLRAYVDQTIERWRLLRPAVPLVTHFAMDAPTPVVADDTLSLSLTSLLNNAADASPGGIELATRCDRHEVTLEIMDRGPGIPAQVMRNAGRALVTTKPSGKGWGIGLLLANATVERLGGSIVLMNRPEGGSCTRVTLPLIALRPRGA